MNKNLLIIFTRNPEFGKVKTRLAATIGSDSALNIYKFLLEHTVAITKNLEIAKQVHYSVKIRENDIWDASIYKKKQQFGKDLGNRMKYAFQQGYKEGFERIVIIGSDMYDLSQQDIEASFTSLQTHDFVVGPAKDGGYYLLGMTNLKPELFENKNWGTSTVLKRSLKDLKDYNVKLLEIRNDIDYYEDIEDIEVFQPYILASKVKSNI